jgi:hypothetical protein
LIVAASCVEDDAEAEAEEEEEEVVALALFLRKEAMLVRRIRTASC